MSSQSFGASLSHADDHSQQLAAGKRRRKLREALVGYVFVLPAAAATFIFGLWPVVAGFYESLKSGSPITNRYVGLTNYVRSLGSLTYVLLFGLCVIFLVLGYRVWRGAFADAQARRRSLALHVVAGFVAAAGLIALAFLWVTGIGGYGWVPSALLLLALGGYYTADWPHLPPAERNRASLSRVWLLLLAVGVLALGIGPRLPGTAGGSAGRIVLLAALAVAGYQLVLRLARIRNFAAISSTALMATLMLSALLLARYTYDQMQTTVQGARDIATLIFNQAVLSATVDVPEEDARIRGLLFEEGEITVEVRVGGETIQAPLAPEAYQELPVSLIDRLEAGFAANQRVQVVLPDGRVTEGQLVSAPGEHMAVGFVTDEPRAVREVGIYSALDVGEAVVRNSGHTEPLRQQMLATLGMLVGLAAVYFMGQVRRSVDDDEHPHIHRWLHVGRILMGVVILIFFFYVFGAIQLSQQTAAGMGALSVDQFRRAYEFSVGSAPPATMRAELLKAQLLYWPQVFSVALGALLIGFAYLVWQSAQRRDHPLGFALTIGLAVLLMVGGWLLLSEMPRTLELGGRETKEAMAALERTAMYSIGTVPVQLALGLFLAYLLFSEVSWGKSLYRVIYFMPYIAPSVATSTVFLVIFRYEAGSLANRAVGLFGIDPLTWLKDPTGVFRILYAQLGGNPLHFPDVLAGPSLALTTVILYNIWVFAGYNAVVFLAGLGAIPRELYEAAEVDGAGRWSRFRSITLPLLSPTTFFLSMLSIIGTFKAFSHIYVLRAQATGKEIDTMSVHIFNTLYSANDPGYAAALAFSLFGMILVLTLVQNRLAREQVFYG